VVVYYFETFTCSTNLNRVILTNNFLMMSSNKITTNLKDFLQKSQPEKEIEVVIELTPVTQAAVSENLSRNQKIANLKEAFNNDLEPVAKEISNQGGNIVDAAWINQTINAMVTTKCIEELAQLKEVTAIDLPNRLSRD
jgi:hypothetical protein